MTEGFICRLYTSDVFWITASGHDIRVKPVGVLFVKHLCQLVGRIAGGSIVAESGNHTAHLASRHHFLGQPDGQRICDKLMVDSLIDGLVVMLFPVFYQPDTIVRIKTARVDFIEWQPVINVILKVCLLYTSRCV